jgi:transposase
MPKRRRRACTSGLTDIQWAVIAPMIPNATPGGRSRKADKREVVEAILHVLRAGCAWRLAPRDFPSWQTVSCYPRGWEREGAWACVLHALVMADRKRAAARSPSAAILDSRTIRTADQKEESKGYDAGKPVRGRERHILTDTDGWLFMVEVRGANVQDRERRRASSSDPGGGFLSSRAPSRTAAMRGRVPRGARPWVRAMLARARVSSMETSRAGSRSVRASNKA